MHVRVYGIWALLRIGWVVNTTLPLHPLSHLLALLASQLTFFRQLLAHAIGRKSVGYSGAQSSM